MSNNRTDHGGVAVEQSTAIAAPIHEVAQVQETVQSAPLGK
jgi:hypothetical protein